MERITDLDTYQTEANRFASYSGNAAGIVPAHLVGNMIGGRLPAELAEYLRECVTFLYPSSKLAGEAGEVAEKLAKQVRDKKVFRFADISPEDRKAIVKEMGDVLWYLAEISKKLEVTLSSVATANIEKLTKRIATGTILGDGDDRELGEDRGFGEDQ
jgi:NTP pyrophosphatase (non-canonical NTP hydrolase)